MGKHHLVDKNVDGILGKKYVTGIRNETKLILLQRKEAINYVGVLISLWLLLFAAKPKEYFLDGLKKS
jgi:hypothetical protein